MSIAPSVVSFCQTFINSDMQSSAKVQGVLQGFQFKSLYIATCHAIGMIQFAHVILLRGAHPSLWSC